MLMRQAAPATMQAMLGRRNQKRKCLLGTKPETEKDRAQSRQNNTHNPRIWQATFAQKEGLGPVYIVSTQACIGPLTHAITELYRSEEQRRLFKKSMPLMFCLLVFFVGKTKEDKDICFHAIEGVQTPQYTNSEQPESTGVSTHPEARLYVYRPGTTFKAIFGVCSSFLRDLVCQETYCNNEVSKYTGVFFNYLQWRPSQWGGKKI